jgi:hypothetical protein
MSDLNSAPPLPRGQMPIEEVFRMMWARMNYLENALKDAKFTTLPQVSEPANFVQEPANFVQEPANFVQEPANFVQEPTFSGQPSTITLDQLRSEPVAPSLASVQENVVTRTSNPVNYEPVTSKSNITLETIPTQDNSDLIETINSQEERINEICQTVQLMKSQLTENHSTFNETIDNISTDLSEMNSKYTQMNNFLMEIQTTQITVNNQILRHYNENYNEVMESAIEKSAAEKFAQKEDVEDGEDEELSNDGDVEASTTDATNNETTTTSETETETETSKTMSFNIE